MAWSFPVLLDVDGDLVAATVTVEEGDRFRARQIVEKALQAVSDTERA